MKEENSKVLVCVTDQYSCERLIKRGAEIAKENQMELQVLNVSKPSSGIEVDGKALEFLYKKAKNCGAEVVFYFNDEPVLIIAGHVKKYNVCNVITGMPENGNIGFIQMLHTLIPDVPITMVPVDPQEKCITLQPPVIASAAK